MTFTALENMQNEDLNKWSLVNAMTFKNLAIYILWKVLLKSTKIRISSFACTQKMHL